MCVYIYIYTRTSSATILEDWRWSNTCISNIALSLYIYICNDIMWPMTTHIAILFLCCTSTQIHRSCGSQIACCALTRRELVACHS